MYMVPPQGEGGYRQLGHSFLFLNVDLDCIIFNNCRPLESVCVYLCVCLIFPVFSSDHPLEDHED